MRDSIAPSRWNIIRIVMTASARTKLAMALRLAAEAIEEWDAEETAQPRRRATYRTPRRPKAPTAEEMETITEEARTKAERALRERGLL